MNRPDLLKPDFASAYYELTGPSFVSGRLRQGGNLVEYVWRNHDFDESDQENPILNGKDFDGILQMLSPILFDILHGNLFPGVKGAIFYFDIPDQGTTTFAELFMDIEKMETRQVIYNLKSRDLRIRSFKTIGDILSQMQWMKEHFKPKGQTDIQFIGHVTYKRYE